ncbi:MAG: hypothetical protein COC19_03055 [SAR86 cluster bacterium]|uniref:Uncharacterized protein n=1 Tax=SAR86 cluster bacterium TaxID=2030880 RepID=A0A2A4MQG9_9GAMM|nr:MAG: hypothetical protein COC19_03055 [SAR86 cluster bacterium]
MKKHFASYKASLAPAEEIFFTWLPRVFASAALVGAAWIDDAPPLEIVALLIAAYVAARVISQFGALRSASPFHNPILSALFACFVLALLGGVFLIIVTYVERIALAIVN